jgi:hypothetical protein
MKLENIYREIDIGYGRNPVDPEDTINPYFTTGVDSIIINLKEWNSFPLYISLSPHFLATFNGDIDPIELKYHILLEKRGDKVIESIYIYFRSQKMAREYLSLIAEEMGIENESAYSKLGDQFKI